MPQVKFEPATTASDRSQTLASAALPPLKRLGTHCTGGWAVPRPENLAITGIRFPDVQPAASHYTDCAIAAQTLLLAANNCNILC